MTHYTILHNPRCSKSRQALGFLEHSGITPEVIDYQSNFLTLKKLQEIKKLLGNIPAIEFTREKEKEFKENNLTKTSSDRQIFEVMLRYPNLLQRPIIIKDGIEAVIGRDAQSLKNIL